jgi:hypothetical protein
MQGRKRCSKDSSRRHKVGVIDAEISNLAPGRWRKFVLELLWSVRKSAPMQVACSQIRPGYLGGSPV